ncbi:hypothetical protein J4Q44_G00037360 [Coregonus suidteri]|uniref:HTH psq-type domain-containing protein n=1 Tax=Coregonus suidteri TaxID=861788 RepID=A0AAN8R5L6_9TELE
MAAQCRSYKCTVERKGFRRELDSWRHKLINCVGFESILEGIYGPLLLRDLNIFDDCEPEELDDWAVEAGCSFCGLLINDHVPVAAASPSQGPSLSDSSLSAHRFLHAVFHKKELSSGGDPNIPLVAQELMRRMVRQFAIEYVSKTHLTTSTSTATGSQRSDLDTPLDLTVTRNQENQEEEPTPANSVLDLSKRSSARSPTFPKASGRQQRWGAARAYQTEYHHAERSSELSEGLLSKALRDVRSGSLQENRAALLYGIPPGTLRSQLEAPGPVQGEDVTSQDVMSSARGGEMRLALQRVAAWAELGAREENGEMLFSSSCLTQRGLQRALSLSHPHTPLRIPQVRSSSRPAPRLPEPYSLAEALHYHHPPHHGATTTNTAATSSSLLRLHRALLPDPAHHHCSSLDDPEDGAERSGENKQSRKKRGRYRQYNHDLLEEAITMVMGGGMSVSKAQVVYGIPHSTLEYKVKERNGTLKIPPKRRPVVTADHTATAGLCRFRRLGD